VLPDSTRRETQFDAAGRPVSTTSGSLTRQMAYDDAGRVIQLTNENGRHTEFTWDALDRLMQQTGFDGRTQRYQYGLTGKLTQSDDEGLITLWHYDESDRLTHRTVSGEPAEQWQYDERGWLSGICHLSEGQRVAVHYDYNDQGRLTRERQTVHAADSEELLWQHDTRHAWQAGLATCVTPDGLPAAEWLTYGSGHLAGMKLGDTPLIDFTRDRLHRETQRTFGNFSLTTGYMQTGQLSDRTATVPSLSRAYRWNDNGELITLSGPHTQRQYQYENGRLHSTHINDQLYISLTDPAGNRLTGNPLLPAVWPDNRPGQDAHFYYHHDHHGNLTEKDERAIRKFGSHTHHYRYDPQHRLVEYQQRQNGYIHIKSRYRYDPLGRRISKQVWKATVFHDGSCSQPELKQTVWYGWDGDRLTTTETEGTRVQTIYLPGSFTPLLRIETPAAELRKAVRRTLAEKLQQEGSVTLPPELTSLLDRLELEIQQNGVSEDIRQWLAGCGLTVEQMAGQMEPVYIPDRKIHLYHCDHRGLPLALINMDGSLAWQAEYDEWGNLLHEDNPQNLQQLIRLPGQQSDEETGLYYNRHRYYDPMQGRYITQDPIGLRGGWNAYGYPLDPLREVDALGLERTKIDGRNITVHNADVDPWPSDPHGHIYDSNEVIDKDGNIYDKSTGKYRCALGKKSLAKWTEFLKGIGKISAIGDLFFMQDLSMLITKEQCIMGDMSACKIYKKLGGEIASEQPEMI
uniref:RHS repeat domain-containing protein n=1 Tax=Enterobacterales TaxID=91347 RepID=UPI002ED9EA80